MRGPTYFKPLSAEQRLLIETRTTHYEGIECPFIVFEDKDSVQINHAPTIRRATPWRANEEKATETVGAVSTSANGGL